MKRIVYGQETVCPESGDVLSMNVDIGDGFLYDVCLGCGWKRKKKPDGTLVHITGQNGKVQESS